jgi:hypothetical protein
MCKPSCCNQRSSSSTGAIAVIIIALIIIATIGPAAAAAVRVIAEILEAVAIGIGSGIILAVAIWIAIAVQRARSRRQPAPIRLTARYEPASAPLVPVNQQSCLTCGDRRQIVRVIGNSRALVIRPCSDCQPSELAR